MTTPQIVVLAERDEYTKWSLIYVQSVSITTNVASSIPARGGIYSHYVIKFGSDMRQVGCFLRVLPFPPPIKMTATI